VLSFWAKADGAAAHVNAHGYAVIAEGLEAAATVEASGIDAAGIVANGP
jgi:hypothetical protein